MSAVAEWLALGGVALAAVSGMPGIFLDRRGGAGERLATALMAFATAAGISGATYALARPGGGLRLGWPVPGGELSIEVDAISAMFLFQIFALGLLAAIYGLEYWPQAKHPHNGRKLRLFYGLLMAGMALLVIARNSILFLAGWEVMAIAAFMVLTTEDDKREVRQVGYVYFVATRIGTLCLFGMFALLHAVTNDFSFSAPPSMRLANAIFLLGLGGFGLKAGIMPLHIWLPGAHANAPSHVSAIMSGVLLKMGIYGLVRLSSLFAHPPLWWGGSVLALGAISGILGVAFAIGQHDLKRLLAYHSVENIGIIFLGLGTALIGRSLGRGELIVLGLAGALLHTWNHGVFKALLFLSAGSVLHATGTREIDHLGGLARRMPSTATYFLVGAVAICGLPPLNGFVSELLVYLGLFHSVSATSDRLWLAGAFAAPALALIGALAVACFVKVFGAAFLGEPRSDRARHAHESSRVMLGPMAALSLICLFIGMGSPLVAPILDHSIAAWAPQSTGLNGSLVALAPLKWVSVAAVTLLTMIVLFARALARKTQAPAPEVGTWDCGYARPSPTMQYTSSSFAEMLVVLFRWALRPHERRPRLVAIFPQTDEFHSHVPEVVLEQIVLPSTRVVERGFEWMHWVQRGTVQRYLLYILITLLFFLLWR
jgi:hydrogenase-4 component B